MAKYTGKQLSLFKRCIYCSCIANTKDHVPPKLLLEQPYPLNLKTVPACEKCNNAFADDERYFRDAIAHVGFVPSLQKKLKSGGVVMRSLEHSPALWKRFEEAHQEGSDGIIYFSTESC
jgi:hypothetical protein